MHSSQQLYHLHSFNAATLGQKTTAVAKEFKIVTIQLEKNVCLRSMLVYCHFSVFGATSGGIPPF